MANYELSGEFDRKHIAIAGGKGGVGKTVITAAMGIALAERGIRTVVVDADFGGANLHQALGIIAPPLSIKQFVQYQERDLNQLLLETPFPNLRLLAGSFDFLAGFNLRYSTKQRILRNLRTIDADCVLLDLGAGTAFDQLDFFNASDIKIVVVTPEPLSIQDGYNFIKLSLYRKLYRSFRHVHEIRHLFIKLYNSPELDSATFYQEVYRCLGYLDDFTREHWQFILENYHPALVVNMIESEDDLGQSAALQFAVQDILKVRLKNGGNIQFDDVVRQAVRSMQPDLLMSKQGGAADNIRKIVENLLCSNCNPAYNYFARDPEAREKSDRVICSVRCSLWETCSVRNGGHPCRIQAVGYISQMVN